jgi:hypothetical protein
MSRVGSEEDGIIYVTMNYDPGIFIYQLNYGTIM